MEDVRYYTVRQVSQRLQVSEQTVRNWIRKGTLPGVKIGADRAGWRVRESDVDALLKEHER
jgi:excisionase family DNA binding protein